MIYTNVAEVRNSSKLLSTSAITDTEIKSIILDAERYVNSQLQSVYKIPILPILTKTGTINISASASAMTGIGTLFISELIEGDTIFITDTRECITVLSLTSNTALTTNTTAIANATNSTFKVVPYQLAMATKYRALSLVENKDYSDRAYNQDAIDYAKKWNDEANLFIKSYSDLYHDSLVTQQDAVNTPARMCDVVENESYTNTTSFISVVNSSSFI